VAAFDGSMMTTEAGAMLLGATDRQIRLIERFAGCFIDHRAADLVVHEVSGVWWVSGCSGLRWAMRI
jgi:hypothetical protein